MPNITFQDILNKDLIPVTVNIVDGATAANYDVFFTAYRPYTIAAIVETHRVLGTDAGAVTLNVEKLTSGQALDAGTAICVTAFNLKSTINTPVTKDGVAFSDVLIAPGDRLALKDSGTLTAVAGVSVTIYLKPFNKGHYL